MEDRRIGYLFLGPLVIIVGFLFIYPLLYTLWLSFTDTNLLRLKETAPIVGLENYFTLSGQKEFWRSLGNGLQYGIVTTFISVTLGMGSALILNTPFRGRSIATVFIIFPYLLPTVVTARMFNWLFHDVFGIFKYYLNAVGVTSQTISVFGSPELAMSGVIFVSVWRFAPFATLFMLARLQSLPQDWYEAAKVDGASRWQAFRYITLPVLLDAIYLVLLLRFIWIFTNFDIIWLLTGGGPAGSTQHLPIEAYLTTFRAYQAGLGSSVAIIIFMILLLPLYLYLRTERTGR